MREGSLVPAKERNCKRSIKNSVKIGHSNLPRRKLVTGFGGMRVECSQVPLDPAGLEEILGFD